MQSSRNAGIRLASSSPVPLIRKPFWASDSLGTLVTLKALNIIAQGKRT
jgi:hypothetical protein